MNTQIEKRRCWLTYELHLCLFGSFIYNLCHKIKALNVPTASKRGFIAEKVFEKDANKISRYPYCKGKKLRDMPPNVN